MKPIDDIQLTAYALGEGSPAERQQIEEQLREHPEQQATVDDIRALAARLESELAAEPGIHLTDAQRQAILEPPATGGRGRLVRWPLRTISGFAAVAALVTLLFGGAFWAATRNLHGTLLAQIDEKGEMAVDLFAEQQLDELLEDHSPPQERADRVYPVTGIDVDMAMAPPPEIQDFAASPIRDSVELSIPSDSLQPLIMRSLAPAQMASRSRPGRPAATASYGGHWGHRPPMTDPHGATESYPAIQGNTFQRIREHPLSTFSIDVDTASYANVRRYLQTGLLPPPGAVRVEEMVNYFPYDYAPPADETPFAVHIESAACPWKPEHALVRIALKGRELDAESRPPGNLVFLIDVSGSMSSQNRLPLVQQSLKLLARQLTEQDRVSIVTYASGTSVVLPPTPASDLPTIDAALDRLVARGSTAGGAGIQLAYAEALRHLLPAGNNRVILCTDGDFNVGITDSEELAAYIAERAKQGIFLTVLGYGMGNYKDARLEMLSNKGNGNYAYIDTFAEARKVLAEQVAGTLFTIAKDVKLQIEFNPAHFESYRLVGYENRLLAKEDFNDDRKDAGELGAGHTVTAFYELVPHGAGAPPVDPLKYQPAAATEPDAAQTDADPEWLTVKLRYKHPREDRSDKIEVPFAGEPTPFANASRDFRFAASVAGSALLIRNDPGTGSMSFDDVVEWARPATGQDESGYRREFIQLMRNAAALAP